MALLYYTDDMMSPLRLLQWLLVSGLTIVVLGCGGPPSDDELIEALYENEAPLTSLAVYADKQLHAGENRPQGRLPTRTFEAPSCTPGARSFLSENLGVNSIWRAPDEWGDYILYEVYRDDTRRGFVAKGYALGGEIPHDAEESLDAEPHQYRIGTPLFRHAVAGWHLYSIHSEHSPGFAPLCP